MPLDPGTIRGDVKILGSFYNKIVVATVEMGSEVMPSSGLKRSALEAGTPPVGETADVMKTGPQGVSKEAGGSAEVETDVPRASDAADNTGKGAGSGDVLASRVEASGDADDSAELSETGTFGPSGTFRDSATPRAAIKFFTDDVRGSIEHGIDEVFLPSGGQVVSDVEGSAFIAPSDVGISGNVAVTNGEFMTNYSSDLKQQRRETWRQMISGSQASYSAVPMAV
jgi:hypothetical protein